MPVEIRVPRLGWSMEEGTFVRWLKQDGDAVREGDALYELEGDKASQEIESIDSGILRIPPDAPAAGSTVAVGALLGYLDREGGRVEAPIAPVAVAVAGPTATAATPEIVAARPRPDRRPLSTPRARRIARELSADLSAIQGTGKGGRIRERDVRLAASAPGSPSTARDLVSISPRRRAIAEKLLESRLRTVPVTLTSEADATNLVALREQFKATEKPEHIPSFTDLIVKLSAAALRRHPEAALRRVDDRFSPIPDDGYHIGFAVDTPEGLLVPVLRDVIHAPLPAIVKRSRELIARARERRLAAEEMRGGVFSVTNLGAFGIEAFTPIINYPELAILGVGSIRLKPLWRDDRAHPARFVTLSLTFDHLALDGAPAARLLQTICRAVENPSAWLLRSASD